ncbi:MAG: glycosyltransferase family 39 protein, partial [Acidobacteriota bacterium]
MDLDKTSRASLLLPFMAAAGLLLLLDASVSQLMVQSHLDLGKSLNLPTPGYARFLALWMLYASLAAAALAVGFARFFACGDRRARWAEAWNQASDHKWLLYASIFAFLIPAGLRTFLLDGTPLTDDESAYRFMAQVLASGQVYAESPPLKLFFDNRFMVNDGKMYAHFFVGWPALLVPGIWLGAAGFMNAIYSALTMPALFAVLRRLTGSAWARAGTLIYLSSPMLMVTAATETSHTSCVCALAWVTWLCLRSRDKGAPWWTHSLLAIVFCIAFFVRPTSALGVGIPLLLWWLWGLRGGEEQQDGGGLLRGADLRGLVAFAVPTIVLAALFLTVNKLQTGAYFEVAYQRAFTYAEENDFRFSLWPEDFEGDAFTELQFGDVQRSMAILGAAMYRFNVTFLGWPCSLLFALFAGR